MNIKRYLVASSLLLSLATPSAQADPIFTPIAIVGATCLLAGAGGGIGFASYLSGQKEKDAKMAAEQARKDAEHKAQLREKAAIKKLKTFLEKYRIEEEQIITIEKKPSEISEIIKGKTSLPATRNYDYVKTLKSDLDELSALEDQLPASEVGRLGSLATTLGRISRIVNKHLGNEIQKEEEVHNEKQKKEREYQVELEKKRLEMKARALDIDNHEKQAAQLAEGKKTLVALQASAAQLANGKQTLDAIKDDLRTFARSAQHINHRLAHIKEDGESNAVQLKAAIEKLEAMLTHLYAMNTLLHATHAQTQATNERLQRMEEKMDAETKAIATAFGNLNNDIHHIAHAQHAASQAAAQSVVFAQQAQAASQVPAFGPAHR